MDAKRLLQLKQMGLTHWQVRRPQLFSRPGTELVPETLPCELLIVTDIAPDTTAQRLIANVLVALQLSSDACQIIQGPPDVAQLNDFNGWLWFAGVPAPEQQGSLRLLVTPSLTQLPGSPQAKRALWQQMVAYV